MDALKQDIRYGLRMLVKHPGFALVTVLTLALGIGANTAIFSVVNAVLLRPLPYPNANRLVMVWENHQKRGGPEREWTSAANFLDWRAESQLAESMAAFVEWRPTLTGLDEPEQLMGARISHTMLPTLGVMPTLGRNFSQEEDQPGGEQVVILSDGVWRRRFGADPNVIGKTLMLNGSAYTVVGIMPPGFIFPVIPSREIWTTMQVGPTGRGNAVIRVIARLKPGVALAEAQAEMNTIAARLEQQYPDANAKVGISVVSLHEQLAGNVRLPLLVLLGAVGFVLLIACANVANLLLARATARQREIGIRVALGAGQLRLVRQLLTESFLLALIGGALGLVLAWWTLDSLAAALPGALSSFIAVRMDVWVLSFTLISSALTGIIFGGAPALEAVQVSLSESLKESGRGAEGSTRRHRLRSALIVSEMALALVLLVGAGLLLKSFVRLQRVDLGFNPSNMIGVQLILPRIAYPETLQVTAFYTQLLERIQSLPGVRSATATSTFPLSGGGTDTGFRIEGRPVPAPDQTPVAWFSSVAPGFHEAMGIPLVNGRTFTRHDDAKAPLVVIINETMARRYWPDEDPIGKRIRQGGGPPGSPMMSEIVGVVGNIKFFGLDQEQPPAMYLPIEQFPARAMTVAVRTVGDPLSLAASVRKEVWALDKNLAVPNIVPVEQLVSGALTQPRLVMILIGLFAALALVLATVGIYGVVSYSVSQRTHEIGIRMALGARSGDIFKLIIGQGLVLTIIGVGIGLAASLALTRVLARLLFNVSVTDPLTFAGVAFLLATVALLACYLPARRATRVDPMVALRYE